MFRRVDTKVNKQLSAPFCYINKEIALIVLHYLDKGLREAKSTLWQSVSNLSSDVEGSTLDEVDELLLRNGAA